MNAGDRARPMSNFAYRGMEWLMAAWDLLRGKPTHHLRPAHVQPGMTAVDYACGPGHYTIPLAEAVGPAGRVFAVDIQPLALQTVAGLAARRGLQNVTPVLAQGYDTGLPSATADLGVFLDAFHMVADPEALLREVHRLLKPNGMLLMDPGHSRLPPVLARVERLGLFVMQQLAGHRMLLRREAAQA